MKDEISFKQRCHNIRQSEEKHNAKKRREYIEKKKKEES